MDHWSSHTRPKVLESGGVLRRVKVTQVETRISPRKADQKRRRREETASGKNGAFFDANVSGDSKAMAPRQSRQFKRAGVGGRLMITPAVNI